MAAHSNEMQEKGSRQDTRIDDEIGRKDKKGKRFSQSIRINPQMLHSKCFPSSHLNLKDSKSTVNLRAGILLTNILAEDQTYAMSSPTQDNQISKHVYKDDIREHDVLCGRGAGANAHIGNINFRSLVGNYQKSYLSSKPLQKSCIAEEIMSQIISRGGRFLKREDPKNSNYWYVIDHKAAKDKICQALRERAQSALTLPMQDVPIDSPKKQYENYSVAFISSFGVNDKDVLFGRGGVTNSHPGNINYRSLVRNLQREYLDAPKLKKAAVAMRVVEQVYSQGGKFLVEENGKWVEVEREKAREKTSQALREKAPQFRQVYKAAEMMQAVKNDTITKPDHQKPG